MNIVQPDRLRSELSSGSYYIYSNHLQFRTFHADPIDSGLGGWELKFGLTDPYCGHPGNLTCKGSYDMRNRTSEWGSLGISTFGLGYGTLAARGAKWKREEIKKNKIKHEHLFYGNKLTIQKNVFYRWNNWCYCNNVIKDKQVHTFLIRKHFSKNTRCLISVWSTLWGLWKQDKAEYGKVRC